jgi:hypothetical protein
MHEPTDRPTRSFRRVALRAALLIGASSVFLLLDPLAARADDGGSSGLVDQVVDDATQIVADTVDEVGQAVGDATDTVAGVVEETAPAVEDVLDTAVEAVEDVVDPVIETAEPTIEDVVAAVDPVIDDPGSRTTPPPADDEGPAPVRDPADGVTGRRAALELRLAALDAAAPSVASSALADAVPTHARAALARSADPVEPTGPARAPVSTGGGVDRPFNPRVPGGQDLAVLAAALFVALALVRTARREGGWPSSPAFLSILERPG